MNPDEIAIKLFPLTERRKYSERVTRQIMATKHLRDRSFDSHTAQQWLEIGLIFKRLQMEWRLDWCN